MVARQNTAFTCVLSLADITFLKSVHSFSEISHSLPAVHASAADALAISALRAPWGPQVHRGPWARWAACRCRKGRTLPRREMCIRDRRQHALSRRHQTMAHSQPFLPPKQLLHLRETPCEKFSSDPLPSSFGCIFDLNRRPFPFRERTSDQKVRFGKGG